MFVCICNGVTENQIREAVHTGASSVADLSVSLGVAAGCGTCHAFAHQVLLETLHARASMPENRVAA
ncbi:MAG: (2Fe-2S)-binding protein [Betaproteobacteria bacterium]